jgi:hypothetical protein
MPDTPRDPAPHLGDTLGAGRSGRVDPEVGATQGGSPSHERPSFSDPITQPRSDRGAAADRVPGAASTTPEFLEGREGDMPTDQGGFGAHSTGHLSNQTESVQRGAGTPVRRAGQDVRLGESPDASGSTPERVMHLGGTSAGKQAQSSRGEPMAIDDRDRLDAKDASGKGPHTNDIIHHDNHPGVGDHVGEAAGGISGVLTGAAIGSAGGPIGTIIGGIAGAVGGWWSGRAISEAATKFTHADDDHYRGHYEASPSKLADRKYEDVRPAYQLGHVASHNPDYQAKEWDAVEPDLKRGWSDDLRGKHGEWDQVRGYAKDAYTRNRSGLAAGGLGASTGAAAGGLADRNPGQGFGTMGTGNAADRIGDKTENAWDKTKAGAANLGDKMADKADDLKDRVDGNPASRPGPDSTDSANRKF